MNILQVILAYYPCEIWGGPPQNTHVLSQGLIARGHSVQILTSNILDEFTRMDTGSFQGAWEGVPVTYLHAYWLGRKSNSIGFIFTPDIWRYRNLLEWADVVHIQGYRNFLFTCGAFLALLKQKPYIVQARGTLTPDYGRTRLKWLFDHSLGRYLLGNAAQVVALSKGEVADYQRLGVKEDHIALIYNPFDPSLCPVLPGGEGFRRRYGIALDEKVILFLARIHEKKGLDLLVRAFAQLDRTNVKLCIVGPDDGHMEYIQRLIDKLNIRSSVVIAGPLYGKAKYEAYRAADIYVLPTRGGEGLPTTVVEACYAGIPIIITNRTSVAELVHGRIGLSIDFDQNQLETAMKELLDQPEKLYSFRKATQRVLEEYFNLSTALDRFETVYMSATSSSTSRMSSYL